MKLLSSLIFVSAILTSCYSAPTVVSEDVPKKIEFASRKPYVPIWKKSDDEMPVEEEEDDQDIETLPVESEEESSEDLEEPTSEESEDEEVDEAEDEEALDDDLKMIGEEIDTEVGEKSDATGDLWINFKSAALEKLKELHARGKKVHKLTKEKLRSWWGRFKEESKGHYADAKEFHEKWTSAAKKTLLDLKQKVADYWNSWM